MPNANGKCYGNNTDEIGCTHIECWKCIYGTRKKQILACAEYIATHLTPITDLYVPFGMLSKEKQAELKKANNRQGNILMSGNKITNPDFNCPNNVYRLDPKYKSEEQKKADRKAELIKQLEEMGAIVNGKIIM